MTSGEPTTCLEQVTPQNGFEGDTTSSSIPINASTRALMPTSNPPVVSMSTAVPATTLSKKFNSIGAIIVAVMVNPVTASLAPTETKTGANGPEGSKVGSTAQITGEIQGHLPGPRMDWWPTSESRNSAKPEPSTSKPTLPPATWTNAQEHSARRRSGHHSVADIDPITPTHRPIGSDPRKWP